MARPVPTIAGRPSSRLTMAAWEVRPPWSVTMAAARFMIGTQSGSVIPVTRTASSTKRSISDASRRTHAAPIATASPIARPLSRRLPLRVSRYVWKAAAWRRASTVSGRAWTMKISPVAPSRAHSMSMGCP